jgi:kumamolisin
VPEELSGIVVAVLGLDNRRIGRPYLRRGQRNQIMPAHAAGTTPLPRNTYFPADVGRLYDFPPELDGTGQTIGILTFNDQGGGYRVSALQKFFMLVGLDLPTIRNVVVHGQGNDPHDPTPSNPNDSSGEVMLDIQVAGSLAPKATLVLYFTVFTQQGWVDALMRAITDAVNQPSVLSISYGNPEDGPDTLFAMQGFTADALQVINDALQQAVARQITICVASGDNGSSDEPDPNVVHVDFPASSPFVLACGGTTLMAANDQIQSETTWNDGLDEQGQPNATGGGISAVFGVPDYQTGVSLPPSAAPEHKKGRGVPDVSALADPQTGFQIVDVSGTFDTRFPTGGTSASAPLWAALIARINQALGARVGFLNPLLYTQFSTGVLRDITEGNNGAYQATSGWDACTGWGSPGGRALLKALGG